MRSIAVCSLKGGVGKTATAVNLAWHAANQGYPTLLWDLDAQAASSWYLKALPTEEFKASRLVKDKITLGSLVQSTSFENLDIIPSDLSMRKIDTLLADHKQNLLTEWLSILGESYKVIILDCPPTLSHLTQSLLEACDKILAPALPTHLSFASIQHMLAFMEDKNIPVKKLHPVLTMIDRRKKLHQEFLQKARKELGRKPLGFIPYASDVEKMGEYRAPLGAFAPRCPAAIAYQLLWENVNQKVL